MIITKEIRFCAAHRLYKYEGACANVHGHNYRALVSVKTESVNALGLGIDFKDIKEKVQTWVDVCWDHAVLINVTDAEMVVAMQQLQSKRWLFPGNPTAENMACTLLREFPWLHSVKLYETETSYVEVFSNEV